MHRASAPWDHCPYAVRPVIIFRDGKSLPRHAGVSYRQETRHGPPPPGAPPG